MESPSGGMADTYASGAYAARREGSTPFLGTSSDDGRPNTDDRFNSVFHLQFSVF